MQRAIGLIPGWGTKILHTTGMAKKQNQKHNYICLKKKKDIEKLIKTESQENFTNIFIRTTENSLGLPWQSSG